jgi:hypothetical protein
MGLEMRPECERCGGRLEANGAAFVCSYECTFCGGCAQEMDHVCPKCTGELVRRPRRLSEGEPARRA